MILLCIKAVEEYIYSLPPVVLINDHDTSVTSVV